VPVPRASSLPPSVRVVLFAVLVVVLTGCRLDVTAELTIARDGRTEAAIELAVDEATLAELDALGVDPTAELTAAARQAPGWEVIRERPEDGGLAVRLVRPSADAAAAAAAFRELTAGLVDDDPALVVDVEVEVDPDGAVRLEGEAGFRPPATPGATIDGEPVGPDATELAALTAEAVTARLVVRVPGPFVEHDADEVDGRTATWELPVGEPRPIRAVAAAPTGPPTWVLVAVAATLLVVALAAITWWWVRRRRR
jgi:hypothetical protein